jgi:short-subunit dehydrogenase
MREFDDRWAVVTGASSGLGVDFARGLARRGANLVLVARREDRMKQLGAELEAAHGVHVRVIPLDLAKRESPTLLFERTRALALEIDVLVNNAGFGLYGPFAKIPWEREHEMLELDVVSLVHLTKLFLPGMLARGRGWLLHVASIGAYQPTPTYASYSAAKSFVLSFGEALCYELRGTQVKSTVVSPGVTRSEFLAVSGQTPNLYQRSMMMESAAVAEAGIRAMLRGRPSVTPGVGNKLGAFSMRLLPRRMQAAIANRSMNLG